MLLGGCNILKLCGHFIDLVVKLFFDLGLHDLVALLCLLQLRPDLTDDLLLIAFLDALGALIADLRLNGSSIHGVNVLLL